MKTDTSKQIAVLPSLTKAQLLPIWAENFHTDPPPKLRKELMVPILLTVSGPLSSFSKYLLPKRRINLNGWCTGS
jgi:hypothetical protein